MRTYKVTCPLKDDLSLGDRVEIADDFLSRAKGLLGRAGLEEGEGLLITRTNSIHMFFMRFAIDVVFLSESMTVKKVVRNVPPWWFASGNFWSVAHALELPANHPATARLEEGDILKFTENVPPSTVS